jgi:hypothetical protein
MIRAEMGCRPVRAMIVEDSKFAAHHIERFVSRLGHEQRTRLSDLALVGPNCHRMPHRGAEPSAPAGLAELLNP